MPTSTGDQLPQLVYSKSVVQRRATELRGVDTAREWFQRTSTTSGKERTTTYLSKMPNTCPPVKISLMSQLPLDVACADALVGIISVERGPIHCVHTCVRIICLICKSIHVPEVAPCPFHIHKKDLTFLSFVTVRSRRENADRPLPLMTWGRWPKKRAHHLETVEESPQLD